MGSRSHLQEAHHKGRAKEPADRQPGALGVHPQTITAKAASGKSAGGSGGAGSSAGATPSSLSDSYKNYLSNDRGKSPAIDNADSSQGLNTVSQMPY